MVITIKDVMESISGGVNARYSLAPGRNFDATAREIYRDYRAKLKADECGPYTAALEAAADSGILIRKERGQPAIRAKRTENLVARGDNPRKPVEGNMQLDFLGSLDMSLVRAEEGDLRLYLMNGIRCG
jgi:hypothetical protein